ERAFSGASAGTAVPILSFYSAAAAIGGMAGFTAAITDSVTIGIVAALVLGKPIGIVVTTWALTRVSRAELDDTVKWIDLVGVSLLAGIGFTVSLLIGELSFGLGSTYGDDAKVAILCASVLAAVLASVILVSRNRRYRAIVRLARIDADGDGVPDVYQK